MRLYNDDKIMKKTLTEHDDMLNIYVKHSSKIFKN